MNVTLIPETAPFSVEQRAWLNGFFAGMMGLDGGAAGATLAPADPPAVAEDFPWHDPALSAEERMLLAEGRPVARRLMAAMAQLDCGACGYVCQSYAEAIADGSEKSLTKCAPGGKETGKLLKLLVKEVSGGPASVPATAKPAVDGGPSRDRPAEVPVLELRNLNKPGSAKHTTHVELDLAGSGVAYRAGDALGVYPVNCPDLVGEILAELGAGDDEAFRHELLTGRCLGDVTDELLALLGAGEIDDGADVLDVLRAFPSARPAAADVARALSPISPRLYSISSSPLAHPGRVHLTVGRVEFEHGGRRRKGVASTMFSDRLRPGDRVRVFAHAAHGFGLPADPDAPLVMVGPGTGIAPFRAFLQERQVTGAAGRNWLFFGDQRKEFDFLYADELGRYFSDGLLTRLDTAFSRDGAGKVYVQDRMREHGSELFRWLEDGAHVRVCGDAKRMAADVDRTLRRLAAEHGGLSAERADDYVRRMTAQGRYQRDVY